MNASISFRWLGTAGIELGLKDQVLVIDPYLTRFPMWKIWLGRVRPSRELIAETIQHCGFLLVTHAHWDHIMDVSDVVQNTGAVALGSRNSSLLLAACGVPRYKIRQLEVGDELTLDDFGVQVRKAEHGWVPGFSPGPLPPDLRPPLRARQYRMDEYYSFLISGDGVRLLTDPGVHPEDAVVADVLFVHPGSDSTYYEVLLPIVQPKLVIPIHWDDFFRPLSTPLRPYWKPPRRAFPALERVNLAEFRRVVGKIVPYARTLEPEIFCVYDLGEFL